MRAAYSEMLERIRQEGVCRAGKEQAARRSKEDRPAGEGPAESREWKAVECGGCWYWRMLDYTMGIRACWYPLLENRLRPCLPTDCYKKPGTPYRPCETPGTGRPDTEKTAAKPQKEKEGSE